MQSPAVELGGVFIEMMSRFAPSPLVILYPALVVWACAFAFYMAADAVVGYFNSKQFMARFEE